ncbi:MAG: ABC transporter substrate-binding protein [Pseudomonadota bacterium]
MDRRSLLHALVTMPAAFASPGASFAQGPEASEVGMDGPVSVTSLPKLKGKLTLYLGRGEGGLYEKILESIQRRNPDFELRIRRGPSTALANTLVAESRFGKPRADVFWSIDASSLGLVVEAVEPSALDDELIALLKPEYRYERWLPISGRFRTLAYNPNLVNLSELPDSIMTLPDEDLRFGWAPAYGAFQSFVTAMRLLEGDDATGAWLESLKARSKSYAGELNVVMGTSQGESDIGFANHYYTLRLLQGRPDTPLGLAFTRGDAGCLLNASGTVILKPSTLARDFVRHLMTNEVQGYLAREAFEVPLLEGVPNPKGLPPLASLQPPRVDLEKLADVRPTLSLLRQTGVL